MNLNSDVMLDRIPTVGKQTPTSEKYVYGPDMHKYPPTLLCRVNGV